MPPRVRIDLLFSSAGPLSFVPVSNVSRMVFHPRRTELVSKGETYASSNRNNWLLLLIGIFIAKNWDNWFTLPTENVTLLAWSCGLESFRSEVRILSFRKIFFTKDIFTEETKWKMQIHFENFRELLYIFRRQTLIWGYPRINKFTHLYYV